MTPDPFNKIQNTGKIPWLWLILIIIFLPLIIQMLKNPLPFIILAFFIYSLYKIIRNNGQFNFNNLINKKTMFTKDNIPEFNPGRTKKIALLIIVAVIAIFIIAKSIVIVEAGQTGVYHLFGKVKDNELRSGIHLVFPLAQVTKMSVRTEEYTMSIAPNEGRKKGDDSIYALTKEGLEVSLDITVFFHLIEDRASNVYKDLGTDFEEKIIRPEIRSAIREVVAQYEAKDVYSEKRSEVTQQLQELLEKNINPRGIEVESILLRNVTLPSKLAESIQQKLTAEQESQRYDFVLDKEKKEAERKIIEAGGQRDAQKIINESLSTNYLYYLYIKELKDRQGTIYVPTNPETGMPLFRELGQ